MDAKSLPMTMVVCTVLGGIISLVASRAEASSGPEELEGWLAAYEAGIESLATYDVMLQATTRRKINSSRADDGSINDLSIVQTNEEHYCSRQLLTGENFRFDVLRCNSNNENPVLTAAWNGEQYTSLNYGERVATIAAHPGESAGIMDNEAPRFAALYRMAFGNYKYPEVVRDRASTIDVTPDYVTIDAYPAPDQAVHMNVYGVRISLDRSRGNMPAVIEWYTTVVDDSKEKTLLCTISNDLEEVSPGIWAPMSGQCEFFNARKESAFYGKAYAIMEYVVNRASSRFNQPIDEDLFKITVPAGTAVADKVRKLRYMAGSEGHAETLNDLSDLAKGSMEEANTDSDMAQNDYGSPSKLSSNSSWRPLFFWVNGILLIVIIAGFTVRRWRR